MVFSFALAMITFVLGVAFFVGVHQLPLFANTIGATFVDMVLSGLLYYVLMLFAARKEA